MHTVIEQPSYNRYGNISQLGKAAMTQLKVTTIGNSVGVVLPKDLLTRLRVSKGDTIFAVETPNGVELTAYDPHFAAQIEAAEAVMREDRDVLKKLAE